MTTTFGKVQVPKDLEAETLVRGKGQYTDDVAPADSLHAVFLRSDVAHGVIQSIDVVDAQAAEGVLGVYTAADFDAEGCQDMQFAPPLMTKGPDGEERDFVRTPRPILARDKVRHVGEPIAMVVARTKALAQDALDLIAYDIEELAPVLSLDVADADAEDVWDAIPGNQSYLWQSGDTQEVAEALTKAKHRVSVDLRNQRLAGSPLEPRAAVGQYDAESGKYTVHCGSQGTTIVRAALAGALGVEPPQVHVVTGHVGGGFGLKVYAFPEYAAVMAASRLLSQPVRWNATRSEALLSDTHGRASELRAEAGFDDAGMLQALSVKTVSDLGSHITGVAAWVQSTMVAECVTGPYATPKIAIEARGMVTNTIPVAPYRGSGRPEAAYLLERLMDVAAEQLSMDRMDLRTRNLIGHDQLPYTTPTGQVYDSGNFAAVQTEAMKVSDWQGFAARQAESAAKGRMRGIGCSLFLESSGPFPQEPVDLRVTETGQVELRTAAVSNGQRHVSTFTHIIAERLGIDAGNVTVIAGDSENVPAGPPSVGSRTMMMTGSAIADAVAASIERGKAIVAELSDGRPNDIDYADGVYTVAGTQQTFKYLELPALAAARQATGQSIEETLDGVQVFTSPGYTFPNGCHIAEVEVDPETGVIDVLSYVAVDDSGTVINPPIVEGQLIGGIAQGLGQIFMEEVSYDEDGQLLSGSFMDYAMPRATDMPKSLTLVDLPDPTPSNPLGAKGVGEAGTTGSLAAVVNASIDALKPLGVKDLQMPLSPCRVWEAITGAQAGA